MVTRSSLIPVVLALALVAAGCGDGAADPPGSTATTAATPPAADSTGGDPRERTWEGPAYDLFGLVRVEATAPDGVPRRATVFDDGVEVGSGNLVAWVDDGTPEPIAMMATADCARLGLQLDRWSDVLYRLDLSDAEKAEAAAFLRFGVDRAEDLDCGYVVEREGRATPFP